MKETNMEHFRSEIEELKYSFGFINGEIKSCGGCYWDCEFHPKNREDEHTVCSPYKLQWLMSEYKPEPVLTQREKGFVECIRHGWIAADEVGSKMWYEDKPKKDKEPNVWLGKKTVTLNDDYFPFITWEDEEAWSVEDLRKLKVQDAD